MRKKLGFLIVPGLASFILIAGTHARAQQAASTAAGLPVKWEELTAQTFIKAAELSGGTCVVPLGVIEKHGPHLPLGTDLLDVRAMATRAAQKEYTIVFPEYYFSQIFEARHQPGTIAYSTRILWEVLQETCDEIARNGIKKILLVSGHGGNNNFLPYFCQAQLAGRKDYAVYLYRPSPDPAFDSEIRKMRKSTREQHAGEVETSTVLANRPDLVHLDEAASQSGEDMKRLSGLTGVYTGIWWYASFPNHYAGEGKYGNREMGERIVNHSAEQLAKVIRQVKSDTGVLELQNRFFGEAEQPLKTRQ